MDRKTGSELNAQIYEEACEWFVEFRGGQLDAARRRALAAWLRKSPEQLRAYLEIAAIWKDGPSLDPTGKWDEATLVAQAAAEPDNVFSHPRHSHARATPTVHAAARKAVHGAGWRVLAVAASFLVVCFGVWL